MHIALVHLRVDDAAIAFHTFDSSMSGLHFERL
jgi:hypothetical protein